MACCCSCGGRTDAHFRPDGRGEPCHGSLFMLGAFFGLSVARFTGSFWWALALAPVPARSSASSSSCCSCGRCTGAAIGCGSADLRVLIVFFDLVKRSGAADRAAAGAGGTPGAAEIGLGVFSGYRLSLIGLGSPSRWCSGSLSSARGSARWCAPASTTAWPPASASTFRDLHRLLRRGRGARRPHWRRRRAGARALPRMDSESLFRRSS